MQDRTMSTKRDPVEATTQLPADVASKSAGQIEDILSMIHAGDLQATKAQRAYLAGAAFALRQAQIQD